MTNFEIKDILEESLNQRVTINNINYNNNLKLYEVDYSSGLNHANDIARINDDGEIISSEKNLTVEVWKFKLGPAKFTKEVYDREDDNWESSSSLYTNKKTMKLIDTFIREYEIKDLNTAPGLAKYVDEEFKPYILSIVCDGTSIRSEVSKNKYMVNTDWTVIVRTGGIDNKLLEKYLCDYINGQASDGIGEGLEQQAITTKESTPKVFGSYQYGKKTIELFFSMWSGRSTECKRVL